MSTRRNANRIRGPQSALTDFLAANNISAQQIRDDYLRRRADAETQQAANGSPSGQNEEEDEDENAAAQEAARQLMRRRQTQLQEEVISKIKKGKGKTKKPDKKKGKGKKKRVVGSDDDDEDASDSGSDSEADAEFGGYKKSVPLPGQLENCEVCDKRFTVTPYSKSGPEGGLLCTPCGKDLAKEADKAKKEKKKAGPTGRKRRKVESDKLDGRITLGAKSLAQLCLEKASLYAGDLEDLGDLPDRMMERLSEIFTKKRVMKSNVLPLFSKPDNETVVIHDCAYLSHDDFTQMLATSPHIRKLVLGNACQFHSKTMDYMIEKIENLRWLHLYAANLILNETWTKFITQRGEILEALQLADLDTFFEDEHIQLLAEYSPNLKRLKLKRCRHITPSSLESISQMKNLQHLSLQFSTGVSVPNDQLLDMIASIGPQLQTLSLEQFADADEAFTEALATSCTSLRKLRVDSNDTISDVAWASLFESWKNPPLRFIDLSRTRDVDNSCPDGPEDEPIGLGMSSFPAMMKHSASKLQYLNIASCRHISYEALCEVFDGTNQYPELLELDVSFVKNVDTLILAGLFKGAPKLRKVVAFGCFQIEDVVVPQGIVVIGVPKAQDAIEQFGVAGIDVEGALGGMLTLEMNAGRMEVDGVGA